MYVCYIVIVASYTDIAIYYELLVNLLFEGHLVSPRYNPIPTVALQLQECVQH